MKIDLYNADCLEKMKELGDNSVDAIVTDPPYGIKFMGKVWDNGVPGVEFWQEMLRILKPGGHLLSFGGTRTYHRMAVAIEDAGFEIRDMIEWVYGSGFPKSLNIGKAVDKLQGNEREDLGEMEKPAGNKAGGNSLNMSLTGMPETSRITKGTSEWEGWGTALKPAHEPICMARKPLAEKTLALNVLKYGTGGINIDESRVEGTTEYNTGKGNNEVKDSAKSIFPISNRITRSEPNSQGRFPANLIHDNSEEIRECFPETKAEKRTNILAQNGRGDTGMYGDYGEVLHNTPAYPDSGNASRFFKSIIYQAKASKSERNKGCEGLEEKFRAGLAGSDRDTEEPLDNVSERFRTQPAQNNHPTVKPVALMEYLIKMATPKNGTVLDPFMGSGTTGVACKNLNIDFIGIELEKDFFVIAQNRMDIYTPQENHTV